MDGAAPIVQQAGAGQREAPVQTAPIIARARPARAKKRGRSGAAIEPAAQDQHANAPVGRCVVDATGTPPLAVTAWPSRLVIRQRYNSRPATRLARRKGSIAARRSGRNPAPTGSRQPKARRWGQRTWRCPNKIQAARRKAWRRGTEGCDTVERLSPRHSQEPHAGNKRQIKLVVAR